MHSFIISSSLNLDVNLGLGPDLGGDMETETGSNGAAKNSKSGANRSSANIL